MNLPAYQIANRAKSRRRADETNEQRMSREAMHYEKVEEAFRMKLAAYLRLHDAMKGWV